MLRVCLLVCLLVTPASGQTSREWTDAANNGLWGSVKTVRSTSKQLGKDPRHKPKLHVDTPSAWLAFDARGYILEQSEGLKEDGSPDRIRRVKYDSAGRIQESSSAGTDHVTSWRTEYHYGQLGVIETKTFGDGDLQFRHTTEYDSRGKVIEVSTYDGPGQPVSRAFYGYDEQNHLIEWKVLGPHDQLVLHTTDAHDPSGKGITRVWFNVFGQIIRTMSLWKGELISWWQAPDCGCSGSLGWSDTEKGVTINWEIQPDGTLETVIEYHPGRYGNIECDEIQRLAGNGDLLEKVTFHYERDQHGNWTTRIISVWDPTTNILIPIQEDHRAITYH